MLRRAGAGRDLCLAGVWRAVLVLHDRPRALEAEIGLVADTERVAQVALARALRHSAAIQAVQRLPLGRGDLAEAGRLAVDVAARGAAVEGAQAALRIEGRRRSRRASA